jgi:hypothetical protein
LNISSSRLEEDEIPMTCLGRFKQGNGPCPESMFNIILPGSLSIAVCQDHYGGHYRKKNSHPYNVAVEI